MDEHLIQLSLRDDRATITRLVRRDGKLVAQRATFFMEYDDESVEGEDWVDSYNPEHRDLLIKAFGERRLGLDNHLQLFEFASFSQSTSPLVSTSMSWEESDC